MTAKTCKRYDAAHNPILPHNEMLIYYKSNPEAVAIINRYMPHRYICIPTIEIRLSTQDARMITLYEIYPGGMIEHSINLKEHQLSYLRKLWRCQGRWICKKIGNSYLSLRREGTVILDPLKRFGIWA